MSQDEPETKHLCVSELREYLARSRSEAGGAPDTATRADLELLQVGRPTRGRREAVRAPLLDSRATRDLEAIPDEAEVAAQLKAACSDTGKTTVFRRSSAKGAFARLRVTSRVRTGVVRGSLVALALALVAWGAMEVRLEPVAQLHAVPDAEQAAPPSAPAQRIDPDPASAPSTPSAADGGQRVAEQVRHAVDALLSGDTRAALDAYRQLHAADEAPEFALAVRLLEREWKCRSTEEGSAGSCAR